MRNLKALLPAVFMILLLSNCTYHNEVDYFADSKDTCDTIGMSFQTDIHPILQANCVSCHSSSYASGGINLNGYENVKPYAQSGLLSKVINHGNGVAGMPKNADKLSECTISKVDGWIEQGYKNN